MTTYDITRIMAQIEAMEKGLAVLKRQAAKALRSQGVERPVAATGTGRMNGYTLYVKEGGKRSNWKGLSDRTKAKYSTRAKQMNGSGKTPRRVKGLEEIVGVWNDDVQTYKRPKGRPPKDSVWNSATGKYEKKGRTAKGKYEKKSNRCTHVFTRGGKVHHKGSKCGAKCSGSYCATHTRQHEDDDDSCDMWQSMSSNERRDWKKENPESESESESESGSDFSESGSDDSDCED